MILYSDHSPSTTTSQDNINKRFAANVLTLIIVLVCAKAYSPYIPVPLQSTQNFLCRVMAYKSFTKLLFELIFFFKWQKIKFLVFLFFFLYFFSWLTCSQDIKNKYHMDTTLLETLCNIQSFLPACILTTCSIKRQQGKFKPNGHSPSRESSYQYHVFNWKMIFWV